MGIPTSFSNWNFNQEYVAKGARAGQHVTAASTLVCSGPASLNSDTSTPVESGGVSVFPMGFLQSYAIQQAKQIQRMYEIGSSRAYFIPGRTMGSLSIGRLYYHGKSLLRVLYPTYKSDSFDMGTKDSGEDYQSSDGDKMEHPSSQLLPPEEGNNYKIKVSPGEDSLFLNLGSDLFNRPFGMCLYFKNSFNTSVGAVYLENCYIEGHQFSVNSGEIALMEGASAQYDRMVPMKVLV